MLPANCGNFPLSFLLIPSFSLSADQPGSDQAAAINGINGCAGMGVPRRESLGTCCSPPPRAQAPSPVTKIPRVRLGLPMNALISPVSASPNLTALHSSCLQPLLYPPMQQVSPASTSALLKFKSPGTTHSLTIFSSLNKHLSANTGGDG